MSRLRNKVAIVTGSSRGIGKGIAKVFLQEGASVLLHATCEENILPLYKEWIEAGFDVDYAFGDIAKPETAEQLVEKALAHWGKLDILVNNAGINRDGMLHKMNAEQWERVIDVDLNGAFYCMSKAINVMRQAKTGRIINISSAAWNGNVGQGNYSAAKAGLIGLTKTAALELGRCQITCNAIIPGVIETDMIRNMPEEPRKALVSRIPLGRMGQTEEVGELAAFLASDAAGFITGEAISIKGGMVM